MVMQAMVLALGFAMGFAMQTVPTNTKVYESEGGTCRVAVPSDWTTNEFVAADSKRTMSISVLYEPDAKVEILSESLVKQIHGATKIFENTARRRFVESPVPAFGPNPPGRKWELLIPARPKGVCQAVVTLKEGASEDVARFIAMSLKQEILGSRDTQVPIPSDQIYKQFSLQLDLESGSSAQTNAGFQECTGLDAAALTGSSLSAGSGNRKPLKVTLKRGVIRRQVLEKWLAQTRGGGSNGSRAIVVRMMDDDRTRVLQTWRLLGARIINYNAPELKATGGEEVAIDSMELSCERLDP